MWCRIKEYALKWREDKDSGDDDVRLNFIGMKMAFFRRPFDNSRFKTLNFLPYFGSNNFVINGTQIIPSDNTLRDHLILENFEEDDYQFKTKEFNSGFKIYYEDGNHLKQKYLLF